MWNGNHRVYTQSVAANICLKTVQYTYKKEPNNNNNYLKMTKAILWLSAQIDSIGNRM